LKDSEWGIILDEDIWYVVSFGFFSTLSKRWTRISYNHVKMGQIHISNILQSRKLSLFLSLISFSFLSFITKLFALLLFFPPFYLHFPICSHPLSPYLCLIYAMLFYSTFSFSVRLHLYYGYIIIQWNRHLIIIISVIISFWDSIFYNLFIYKLMNEFLLKLLLDTTD